MYVHTYIRMFVCTSLLDLLLAVCNYKCFFFLILVVIVVAVVGVGVIVAIIVAVVQVEAVVGCMSLMCRWSLWHTNQFSFRPFLSTDFA